MYVMNINKILVKQCKNNSICSYFYHKTQKKNHEGRVRNRIAIDGVLILIIGLIELNFRNQVIFVLFGNTKAH